jgi:hypothetical protein
LIIIVLLSASIFAATAIPKAHSQINELIPDFTNVPYDFFNLSPATTNPVLTAADVTDRNAYYIADCHMFHENNVWYMFFEVYSTVGIDIGLATSIDGLHWTYRQIVLDEPFTLAYPEVFKWNGEYYMVPETYEINQIRLYKATNFPYTWTFVNTIISGHQFVDPSIFRYNNKWWLFAPTITPSYYVYLYYSDSLADPASWHEHPSSPVVVADASEARGGGRTTIFGGNRIIRLPQKCDVSYGEAVRAFEVDTLTDTSFAEHEISQSPIVRASGSGWNKDGMHTADPWWTGDRWLVCADGVSNGIWSVGMYVSPPITEAPEVSNPSPPDGSNGVSVSLSQLSFDLVDYQGDLMNYVVSTLPNIGGGIGTNVANGRYSIPVSGLTYDTTYEWFVSVTDGTHSTDVTYTFTTSLPAQTVIPDWSGVSYDPFHLSPVVGVINPVLKASDVTDRAASIVFAPFIYHEGSAWYMFMCVYGASGDIGLATSNDGYDWTYRQVVLDEPFCLSVPQVFKYGDTYYMTTEEYERNEVRLYRATSFPYTWTYVNSLVSGRFFESPTILRYDGTWWMFVGGGNDICYLYYSDSLTDPVAWHEHPLSPIVNGDAGKGRPGGRSIVFGGNRVIRFAMKSDVVFGQAVRAFQVDTLTKTSYVEHEVPESPIIGASGSGWNKDGMHWVDPWWTGDRWLAAVDAVSNGIWSIGIYETPVVTITFQAAGVTVPVTVSYTYDTTLGSVTIPVGGSSSITIPSGSTISFSYATSVSGGSGVQYVLVSTNPTSPLAGVVSDATVIGNYKTQYYLTVLSPNDTPGGMGWYDEGTTAYATLTTGTVPLGLGGRAVFTGWSGDASGTDLTCNPIVMSAPKAATGNWKAQYLLTVLTDPTGLSPQPTRNLAGEAGPLNGWWYDTPTDIVLTAQSVVGYTFNYWDVDGSSKGAGVNPITVNMNPAHTATAHYQAIPPFASVQTATGTGTATFATDKGYIENLVAVSEASLPTVGKPAVVFPHGFFSFKVTGLPTASPDYPATVHITVTLPSAVPVGTRWYKWHASVGWISLPIGSDNGDNVITITIIDDGTGDFDPAHGLILDPGGPGNPPPPPPPPPQAPVGGEWVPIDKLKLLAPWISSVSLMMVLAASFVYVKHKKKQQN